MHTSPAAGITHFRRRAPGAGTVCALAAALLATAAWPVLALTVSTSSLASGTVGVGYADTVSAAAGTPPIVWSLAEGTLPAGLSIDSGTGIISGTPGALGTSAFVVLASDALSDTASRALSITIEGVPAAVTNLAATRLTTGNDGDYTARIQITFTATTFAATAEVYRAPFGGYPRYDDAGGFIPPTPSYPPGPPWVLTAVTASGQTDEPSSRDAWSYVAFLKNASGAVSTVSNKTAPTTNYALGDVSNGVIAGLGDNQVTDVDVSLLGAHYGISGGAITGASVSYLDVGPTTDLSLSSRPFTDNRIDFEDLIVFASNYGLVSGPAGIVADAGAAAARPARASGPERLELDAPTAVEVGATFTATVRMHGEGRVQGLSAALAWDGTVAEAVAVTSAGWLEAQKGVVLSPGPGAVDAALLGVRANGITGDGALATVTFRARRSGDPALRFARVLARDAANRPLPPGTLLASGAATPHASTALLAPSPNPTPRSTSLTFTLARPGAIELAIYSVTGRLVRTLAQGERAAGEYSLTWEGDDDARRPVAPGVYYARLTVRGGPQLSRALIHL
jgi:hypothetical protein